MLLRAVSGLIAKLHEFARDERASVTVDFVVSIPILLGVLVLTTEYGRVLQMRTALDNAVSDATRYLTRVPYDPATGTFQTRIVDNAKHIISSRINTKYIAIDDPVVTEGADFTTVQISARVGLVSPALSVLSIGGPALSPELKDVEGLIVTSSETFRWFGQ